MTSFALNVVILTRWEWTGELGVGVVTVAVNSKTVKTWSSNYLYSKIQLSVWKSNTLTEVYVGQAVCKWFTNTLNINTQINTPMQSWLQADTKTELIETLV